MEEQKVVVEKNKFSQVQIQKVVFGQFGDYRLTHRVNQVSDEITQVALCLDQREDQNQQCILIQANIPDILRHTAKCLQKIDSLSQHIEYVERLKLRTKAQTCNYFE